MKTYSFGVRPRSQQVEKMLKSIALLFSLALLVASIIVDPNDEEVVKAANEVAKVLSTQFLGKYNYRLARVLKATKLGILGGTDFRMDILVGQTTCEKDEYSFEDAADCDFRTGRKVFLKCTARVFKDSDGSYSMGGMGCIPATKVEIEGF